MSNNIDDGGRAFPVPNDANVNGQEGMTLRDWFAGQALAGFMTLPDDRCFRSSKSQTLEEFRASCAQQDSEAMYRIADAMLRARRTT